MYLSSFQRQSAESLPSGSIMLKLQLVTLSGTKSLDDVHEVLLPYTSRPDCGI